MGGMFPPQPTTSLGSSPSGTQDGTPATKAFWRIFCYEKASDGSSIHHFCVRIVKIAAGATYITRQNDTCSDCALSTSAFWPLPLQCSRRLRILYYSFVADNTFV